MQKHKRAMMKYEGLVILVLCLLVLCEASPSRQRDELSKRSEDNWIRFTNCRENRGGWCECQTCGCVAKRKRDAQRNRKGRIFRFSDCDEFPKGPEQERYGAMHCSCYGHCRCVA
ncbi:unnamed protein product [Owenia fusiformis]|uniref:Uncharacterized protein n=1 Tax=Owenia fusiformis TaxID=6347 RepID=A0A8J1Y9Q6_OWEFU|nr:unnamed protein product [Owenia fusiformis]